MAKHSDEYNPCPADLATAASTLSSLTESDDKVHEKSVQFLALTRCQTSPLGQEENQEYHREIFIDEWDIIYTNASCGCINSVDGIAFPPIYKAQHAFRADTNGIVGRAPSP